MALQLERLAGKLGGDPDLAALAGRLRDQMRRTVAAVRRAVDDLRPPALDELGLVEALREHVAAYRLPVAAGAPARRARRRHRRRRALPPLRAAVEVAAYRIAAEAVANAVRHAGATTCQVPWVCPATICSWRSPTTAAACRPTRSPAWGRRACASGPPSSAAPST